MGFQSQIWMGEIHYCKPLLDRHDEVGRLKSLTIEYPEALRRALISKHLFDAGFELTIARNPARAGDLMFVSGCLFRAAGFMTLVLYALNPRYYTNEKGAFAESRTFPIKPDGFHDKIEMALAHIGHNAKDLGQSVARAEEELAGLQRLVEAVGVLLQRA
jgi:hypothetical protein